MLPTRVRCRDTGRLPRILVRVGLRLAILSVAAADNSTSPTLPTTSTTSDMVVRDDVDEWVFIVVGVAAAAVVLLIIVIVAVVLKKKKRGFNPQQIQRTLPPRSLTMEQAAALAKIMKEEETKYLRTGNGAKAAAINLQSRWRGARIRASGRTNQRARARGAKLASSSNKVAPQTRIGKGPSRIYRGHRDFVKVESTPDGTERQRMGGMNSRHNMSMPSMTSSRAAKTKTRAPFQRLRSARERSKVFNSTSESPAAAAQRRNAAAKRRRLAEGRRNQDSPSPSSSTETSPRSGGDTIGPPQRAKESDPKPISNPINHSADSDLVHV